MEPQPELLPFETYPDRGRSLSKPLHGNNCRHGYGLDFIKYTKQTHCAYCGIDLVGVYENWLNMALDHVVPHSTCVTWSLPAQWSEDPTNRVLSCAACNTFGNRYKPKDVTPPASLDEFYECRDEIFQERKELIRKRHQQEQEFFLDHVQAELAKGLDSSPLRGSE